MILAGPYSAFESPLPLVEGFETFDFLGTLAFGFRTSLFDLF